MSNMSTLLRYNYKQKNNWTCGPAVARVILHHFGEHKSIVELSRILRTTRGGTANRDMTRLFKKYGLKPRAKKNSRLSDIKRYLRRHLVMTAYWIPHHKDSHYSIVKKIDRRRIYFHDPWFGTNHSYDLGYFNKNWWDGEAKRWILAIRKRSAKKNRTSD